MDIKDKIKKFLKNERYILIVLLYFLFFYITYIVWKTNNFLQPALDYSYFDQFIWKYSQFKNPIATLGIPINLLAQHFHIILIFLAPFYWLWNSPYLLGILDVVIVVLSIIPLYLISKFVLKDRFRSALIAFLYGNFIGIQFALDFQFHEITIFLGLFLWSFYFMIKKSWLYFYIFVFLSLLCKENIGLYFVFYGFYLAISQKEYKHGILTAIIGGTWLILAMKVFIPYFRGSEYIYFTYSSIGKDFKGFIINSLNNPLIIPYTIFFPIKKAITILTLFLSGGFLIFFSPWLLIITIPMILERFLNDGQHMWQLSQHYSASISIIIILGVIFGLNNISKILEKKNINSKVIINFILIILFILNIFGSFYLSTPYKKIFLQRQTYSTSKENRNSILKALEKIPKNKSISAVSGIVSYFSKNDNIQYLPKGIGEMDYLIFNYSIKEMWPYKNIEEIKKDEEKAKLNYLSIYDDGFTIVYKKINSSLN